MIGAPPRLEYICAFDRAAWVRGFRSPVLVLATAPEFVDQVLLRVVGGVTLFCDDEETHEYARRRLTVGDVPPAVAAASTVLPAGSMACLPAASAAPFEQAIWASPQPGTWAPLLARLGLLLPPGAALCLLTATLSGTLLSPIRAPTPGKGPTALPRAFWRSLRAGGWTVERSVGLGGWPSLGWAGLGRLAARAGRADLVDRAEQAFRESLADGPGSSYRLVLARRGDPG